MRQQTVPDRQYWQIDHPVVQVLRQRRADGYVAGSLSDGYKVGLAAEGGGMRGVISGAMMTAVDDLGLTSSIDVVYAVSSGATNASYFLAGDSWYAMSIYYDDLTTGEFINFRRRLRGGDILNLDYVFDDVLRRRTPLDFDRVLRSPTVLAIGVTNVDDLRTEVVTDFADDLDLIETLRATTWLPIAVRGTTPWRGRRAVDGGVLTAHPYRLALADGCTHILSMSTRPMGTMQRRHSLAQRYTRRYLEKIRKGLGAGYLAAVRQHWADKRHFEVQRHDPQRPYVLDLAPLPWMRAAKREDTDLGRLVGAARDAYAVAYCALEQVPTAVIAAQQLRVVPRLTAVRQGARVVGIPTARNPQAGVPASAGAATEGDSTPV